jgi:hypothetical protein
MQAASHAKAALVIPCTTGQRRGKKPSTIREGIKLVDSYRDELGGEAAMEGNLRDVLLHLRRDEIARAAKGILKMDTTEADKRKRVLELFEAEPAPPQPDGNAGTRSEGKGWASEMRELPFFGKKALTMKRQRSFDGNRSRVVLLHEHRNGRTSRSPHRVRPWRDA